MLPPPSLAQGSATPSLCLDISHARAALRSFWEQHQEVLLLMLKSQPEQLRDMLMQCMPTRAGGRPARDPVVLWRSVFMATCVEGGKLNAWCRRLKLEPWWRPWLGLGPDEPIPSVSTHYRFIERLERGRAPARTINKGERGRFRRTLSQESQTRKASQGHHEDGPILALFGQCALRKEHGVSPPQDLNQRLLSMLVQLGLEPLLESGFFGQASKLPLFVDGSVCRSHAKGSGIPEQGQAKRYSDPESTWRWSNATKRLHFGVMALAATTRVAGWDVPLLVGMTQPHQAESAGMMELMERFEGELARAKLKSKLKLKWLVADAGYDAAGFYHLSRLYGYSPLIARNPQYEQVRVDYEVNEHGIPLCQAGKAPMRLHERDARRSMYRCPAVMNTRHRGQSSTWDFRAQRCPLGTPCEPNKKMGPSIMVLHEQDPRHSELGYGSAAWKAIYRQRGSVERYFSQLHHKIKHHTYRRSRLWAVANAMCALQAQLRVWMKATQDGQDFKQEMMQAVELALAG